MRISTAGAYRTLRSKAQLAALGICICPFCPAIRRGIWQLWSSLLPMEGQFCAALMRGLRQAQAFRALIWEKVSELAMEKHQCAPR